MPQLRQLADDLLLEEAGALERCIEFVLAETKGYWHGRARAMMCRRLKHCQVTALQRKQLVDCIAARLASGNFSEQFRDQLRLAIHLDPERMFEAARLSLSSARWYVPKHAQWVLAHEGGHVDTPAK